MSPQQQLGENYDGIIRNGSPRLEVSDKWVIYRVDGPFTPVTHTQEQGKQTFQVGRMMADGRRVMDEEIHYI